MPVYNPGWPPRSSHSIATIIAIARKSGIPILAGPASNNYVYPGGNKPGYIRVTSTKRGGSGDYHSYGLAVDFAASMDFKGRMLMQRFANWWYRYSSWMLELIHTTSSNRGYFVKNGSRVSGPYYGSYILNTHRDHVHISMSYRAARTLLNRFPKSKPKPIISVDDWTVFPVLSVGSRGDAVKVLQRSLNWRRNLRGASVITADGIYGDKTKGHVIAWQRAMGIPATGITREDTWRSLDIPTVGKTKYDNWQTHPVLNNRTYGEAVKIVQRALNWRRGLSGSDAIAVDGNFTYDTERHLIAFKRAMGLPQSAVVNNVTWTMLDIPSVGVGRTPQDNWQDYPELTLHDSGEAVKVLQRALNYRRGLQLGDQVPVDGYFGYDTYRHLLAYKSGANLGNEPIVTRETWESLDIPTVGQ